MNRSKLIWGIGLSIIFLIGLTDSVAQTEYEDVIYLKNGEIRRGMIIEEIPYKQVKIQTKDGNIFLYSYDDIERKTKEKPFSFQYNKRKSPWTALILSAIPGLIGIHGGGQLYNGQPYRSGIFFLAGVTTLIVFSKENSNREEKDRERMEAAQRKADLHSAIAGRNVAPLTIEPSKLSNLGKVSGVLYMINWALAMADAYSSTKEINQRSAFDSGSPSPKLSFSVTSIGEKSLGIRTTVRF